MPDEEFRFWGWGMFALVFVIMVNTCDIANAAPSKEPARGQPDRVRACELQIYALQDRLGKLESLVQKHKKADDQVLINLIKRTNNLYDMLTNHSHKVAPK